jgi:hypothetical protein
MIYNIYAMVVYYDSIDAADEEEAIDKFCSDCPYDVDANTIECEADEPQESDHKCHTCKHYTSGENGGSCGSYICKGYSNWESEDENE